MKKFEEKLRTLKEKTLKLDWSPGIRFWYDLSTLVNVFGDWISPEDHQAEVGKIELENLKYREEIARMQKSLRKKNKAIKELNGAVKKIKLDRDEWKTEANQLDKEKDRLITETEQLKSQIGKQQPEIPEVPQFVADCLALIEANDYMISHEQVIEHKEAIVWLEDHQSELMLPKCLLYGYTVEKQKVLVTPCPVCRYEEVQANFCGICGHKNEYVEATEEKRFYLKDNRELESVGDTCIGYVTLYLKNDGYLTTDKTRAGKFTQQEIDSMETGSYEQIEVAE